MKAARRHALELLDEIGGEVAESEIAHHLGEPAVLELLEAETEGLVASRMTFTLTEAGRALIAKERA